MVQTPRHFSDPDSFQPTSSIPIASMTPASPNEIDLILNNTAGDPEELQQRQWCHRFLSQLPKSDAEWDSKLKVSGDVYKLFATITLSYNYAAFWAQMEWKILFEACLEFMDKIYDKPSLSSLFSVLFISTCHIAILAGCPKDLVNRKMRSCVGKCNVSVTFLGDEALEEMRMGVLKGIKLLSECVEILGYRAYELPLHMTDCLSTFQTFNPLCLPFLKEHLPKIYHPTTPLPSDSLFIPALVHQLLGGDECKWDYDDIRKALLPKVYGLPVCMDLDMGEVLESDQIDRE
ncbi:Fc.00g036320.m01.CDS01 [Cosmosporella sp. VM-42]